jgi:type II secretory pathway component PulF
MFDRLHLISAARMSARFAAARDRLAFDWRVREALYRHLSAQIANGVTTETALDAFRVRLRRNKKKSAAAIVGSVARRMRDGVTLANALTAWAPQDEVSLIAAGELAGNLPRALDLIVESTRRIMLVNRTLQAALVTPTIYMAAMYGVLWAIGWYVTPALEQALPRQKAQGLIYALYVAGDLAASWWAILPIVAIAAVIAAMLRSLPRWTGRSRIMAERFFPYSFYRDSRGYSWLMSFTALLRAGMSDTDILKRQWSTATPWLKERLHAIWWRMDNGASLPAALMARGKAGMPPFGFPSPDIVDDIASMAEFSDFSERIATLAVQWADDLERTTLAQVKVSGIAMELLMYGVMGLLMVAINSMSVQIGAVPGM